MKMKVYEVIFEVTETCNNGKERRIKKSVFFKPFDEVGIHTSQIMQIDKGQALLKEEHYYNIVYLDTKVRTILVGN